MFGLKTSASRLPALLVLIIMVMSVVVLLGTSPAVNSLELEPGEELDDLDFDDEELELLPEEDETQELHYRVSKMINNILQNKLSREELLDPSSILRRPLADPLTIEDVTVDQQDMFNSIEANFTMMRVKGLRAIQLDEVTANMSGQSLLVEASIPLVEVNGRYNLSAYLAFVSLNGDGELLLNITDLRLSAVAYFTQGAHGTLQVTDVNATIKAGSIDLHLYGLPSWGGSLINMCSELIFENIKEGLLDDLRSGFKERANAQLKNLHIPLDLQQDVQMIDSLLAEANKQIRASKKEPLKLPAYISRAKQDVILMTFISEVRLVRGVLSGLSTMRRTGEVLARYANQTLSLIANFGFDHLEGSYDWHAHMMGIGPYGTAEISVDDIAIRLELNLRLRRRAKFILRSLKVHRVGQVDTMISGLGTGDPATEILANFLGYAFRQQLADWVMDGCKTAIQRQLDKVKVDILS